MAVAHAICLAVGLGTLAQLPPRAGVVAAPSPMWGSNEYGAERESPWTSLSGWRVGARLEGLLLQVDGERSTPIATQAQLDAFGVLNTAFVPVVVPDLGGAMPKLTITLRTPGGDAVEVAGSYMGGPALRPRVLSRFDFPYFLDATAADPGARGFLSNLPAGFPVEANRLVADWRFHEWGLACDWVYQPGADELDSGDWGLGAGFRFLQLSDGVDLSITDETNQRTARLSVDCTNDLVGPEILVRRWIRLPTQWVIGMVEARAGLMTNAVEDSKEVVVSGARASSGTIRHHEWASVVEGNLFVHCISIRGVTVFLGYHVLFATGIDRAVSQLEPDLARFVGAVRPGEGFLQHGPRFGVNVGF